MKRSIKDDHLWKCFIITTFVKLCMQYNIHYSNTKNKNNKQ